MPGPWAPTRPALSELWRAKQLEYSWVRSLIGRYRDFQALTEEALDFALARFPPWTGLRAPCSMPTARSRPIPRSRRAGRPAGARLTTAILSNGSPAMLEQAVASAGLAPLLDAVLSVHGLRHFKPPAAAYAPVEAALGVKPAQVLFVSSNRWDVAGAAAFGFRAAWVNRAGMPEEYDDIAAGRRRLRSGRACSSRRSWPKSATFSVAALSDLQQPQAVEPVAASSASPHLLEEGVERRAQAAERRHRAGEVLPAPRPRRPPAGPAPAPRAARAPRLDEQGGIDAPRERARAILLSSARRMLAARL